MVHLTVRTQVGFTVAGALLAGCLLAGVLAGLGVGHG